MRRGRTSRSHAAVGTTDTDTNDALNTLPTDGTFVDAQH